MTNWTNTMAQMIQQKHMLSHPFYQAWTKGELSKGTLQKYAEEYYHHVKAFPAYISAIHARCDDLAVRKELLRNLIDEEAGEPNHPDMWKTFALALGVSDERLNNASPDLKTEELINCFRECCGQSSIAAGIAALYTYESQIPSICSTKIEGLRKFYGMNDSAGYNYFTVHMTADVEHSRAEMELLQTLVKPEDEKHILEVVEKVLNALWNFLSSFKVECSCEAA